MAISKVKAIAPPALTAIRVRILLNIETSVTKNKLALVFEISWILNNRSEQEAPRYEQKKNRKINFINRINWRGDFIFKGNELHNK
ncbi:hypothetical protein VHTUMSATKI_10480 [Vibrio harveyi]